MCMWFDGTGVSRVLNTIVVDCQMCVYGTRHICVWVSFCTVVSRGEDTINERACVSCVYAYGVYGWAQVVTVVKAYTLTRTPTSRVCPTTTTDNSHSTYMYVRTNVAVLFTLLVRSLLNSAILLRNKHRQTDRQWQSKAVNSTNTRNLLLHVASK